MIQWAVTGETRLGKSHVQSNLKNQDSIQCGTSEDASTVILAVADGHGSDLSFRSDAGSQLAVSVAMKLLERFGRTREAGKLGSRATVRACDMLARKLTLAWRDAVAWHLDAKPFTQAEQVELAGRRGPSRIRVIEQDPAIAYGSTLLAVLATQTYVLSVQLGDGAILFVDSGGVSRRVFPADPRGKARQTDSLAQREAASKVNVHLREVSEGLPSLILVATDGFTDSFPASQDVLGAGAQCLGAIRTHGFDHIGPWLEGYLEEAESRGSQDDITMGLIVRLDDDGK